MNVKARNWKSLKVLNLKSVRRAWGLEKRTITYKAFLGYFCKRFYKEGLAQILIMSKLFLWFSARHVLTKTGA